MTERILIDLDDVVVDLMGEAMTRGLFRHPPCRWNFTGCCSVHSQHFVFEQNDIFLNAPEISGALHGVEMLFEAGFDVRFVSTPWPTNHQSADHKYQWVEKWIGDPHLLTLTHDKALIPASILIDDKPGLFGPWRQVTYPQAWNKSTWPTWNDGLASAVIRTIEQARSLGRLGAESR